MISESQKLCGMWEIVDFGIAYDVMATSKWDKERKINK